MRKIVLLFIIFLSITFFNTAFLMNNGGVIEEFNKNTKEWKEFLEKWVPKKPFRTLAFALIGVYISKMGIDFIKEFFTKEFFQTKENETDKKKDYTELNFWKKYKIPLVGTVAFISGCSMIAISNKFALWTDNLTNKIFPEKEASLQSI